MGSPTQVPAWERVQRWVRDYPRSVEGIFDRLGRPPRHSFFYPAEDYDPRIIEDLSGLCRRGYGDVEAQLHHEQDTSQGFRDKILTFVEKLHHGTGCCGVNRTAEFPPRSSTGLVWTIHGRMAAGAV